MCVYEPVRVEGAWPLSFKSPTSDGLDQLPDRAGVAESLH